MLSVTQQSETILINNFSSEGLSLEELQNAYDEIMKALNSKVTRITFELNNVSSTDYSAMALIKSCGELTTVRKLSVNFLNADTKIVESLKKLGFTDDGHYGQEKSARQKPESIYMTAGNAVYKIAGDFKTLVLFIGDLIKTLFYFIRHPVKMNWKEMLYYMDRTGADAVPITLLICFLIGVILAYQGLAQLGKFGLNVYVADLVGLSVVRELGPLMVAMICTGRAGSAFAAELGTMKVNEELDAMTTMGLKPVYLLVMPKIMGLMLVMPLLILLGDLVGIIGGGLITAAVSDISLYEYFSRVVQSLIPANVFESIVKGIVFAFLIAAIGCFRGFEAENNAKGVGNATTSSVVSGIFLIILADTAITFIYPQCMHLMGISY